ncbi:DedA family protein [Xylanimonas protaetiae]|uniref:DedA family protein n=1 Tax=Xylanimonas protaetiae TaxID=2509457 RepID=A0A4P6F5M0_9MICO|nr:VTT domain-containing protein [Xylanimonas protaetiae]QAY70676.1 DedA family protein [Xylanimonas protaetiae]
MLGTSLVPWLDPQSIIHGAGPWALLAVCAIVFAETGLLVGFVLPGDTLLLISGVLSAPGVQAFHSHVAWVALGIALAAFLGGELGYAIGHKAGRPIFERRESGLFSRENVERTTAFFGRFGPAAVVVARFVPVIRTFAPVAAGVGHMPYRRYSLYNAVGALLWAGGTVYLGYALHFIPPVQGFVERYFDLVLVAAVVLAVVPTAVHLVNAQRKARRSDDAV